MKTLIYILTLFITINALGQNLQVRYSNISQNQINVFPTSSISSDYGKRNHIHSFHNGIDYGAAAIGGIIGTPLVAIVPGTVRGITGFKQIKIGSTDPNNHFSYAHIFNDDPLVNGALDISNFVFIQVPNTTRYAILNEITGIAIGTNAGDVVSYNGTNYTVQNTVTADQKIAPMGVSGCPGCGIHLHLFRLIDPAGGTLISDNNTLNPLQVVNHSQPTYNITFEPNTIYRLTPTNSNTYYAGNESSSIGIRVEMQGSISTTNNQSFTNVTMNIEKVELFIKRDFEQNSAYNLMQGVSYESRIQYGGLRNANGTFTNIYPATLPASINPFADNTHSGVDPHAYSDGNYDLFYFSDIFTRISSTHVTGQTPGTFAACNASARYPDGRYNIFARATTVTATNNQFENVNSPETIIIDNFRPYIEKVEITRQGETTPVYSRGWTWNVSQLEFGTAPSNPICDNSKNFSVKISTSEPMQDVKLTAFGLAQITQTTPTNTNRKEWTFTYTSAQLKTGSNTLSITGTDLAGNPVEGFISTGPITSFPIRQNDGTWNPAAIGNADGVHTFNIVAATASTPTNVAASNSYTDKIIVLWDPVPSATHYNVYRSLSNNSASATSISGWITSTNYNDINVTPDKVYYYWIKAAKSSSGDASSNFSTVVSGTVLSNLTVNFSYNQISYAPNYQVDFTDNSTGDGIKSWSWNFGDGSTSTTQNPSHKFNKSGTFNVQLTATDLYNISKTKLISVLVIDNYNESVSISVNRWNLYEYEYEFIVNVEDPDISHIINITINFGDGSSSTAANNTPVKHTFAVPSKTINMFPYADINIKNSSGQSIYQKNVNFSDILLSPPITSLTLSVKQNTTHISPGGSSNFTASSANGVGTIYYTWNINTDVNELTGVCNANTDANCFSFAGATTGSVIFPTAGNYKVVVWAYDQNGNQGYLEYIVNVGDLKDPCIAIDFMRYNCNNFYEYPLNSELPMVDWATTGVYACYDNTLHKFKYDDIKAIKWYKNGGLMKEYIFTQPRDCYGYSYQQGLNPYCYILNAVGNYTLEMRAYGGWIKYNSSSGCFDLEYATGNPYSSVSKQIKVVNFKTSIDIINTPITSLSDYTKGEFTYGRIICGGGTISQNIPSGKTLTFLAYDSIELKGGFKATKGSYFKAKYLKKPDYKCSCSVIKSEQLENDSEIVMENKSTIINVYPNPTLSSFFVELIGELSYIDNITIYDIIGKPIIIKNGDFLNKNEFNLDGYASGVYIIKVSYQGKLYIDKIIKK